MEHGFERLSRLAMKMEILSIRVGLLERWTVATKAQPGIGGRGRKSGAKSSY